jgi:hypothetical protein
LFCFKIIEFVITCEGFHHRAAMSGDELALFMLSRMRVRVTQYTYGLFQSILHPALPRAEALLRVVFLQQLNEGLVDRRVLNFDHLWPLGGQLLSLHFLGY